MESKLRVVVNQINQVLGDFEGNFERIQSGILLSLDVGANMVIFPEMSLGGFPPKSLIFEKEFIERNNEFLEKLINFSKGKHPVIIAGIIEKDRGFYNSAVVIKNGELISFYRKNAIAPENYFHENFYFERGRKPLFLEIDNFKTAVTISDDLINGGENLISLWGREIDLIVNISAFKYIVGSISKRIDTLRVRAKDFNSYIANCNLVGAQDSDIFDGTSVFIDSEGEIAARGKSFEEDFLMADFSLSKKHLRKKVYYFEMPNIEKMQILKVNSDYEIQNKPEISSKIYLSAKSENEEILQALKLSLSDYCKKNGFSETVLGLSGGIDSSLVASIAVLALGKENVTGVLMPSPFSSEGSIKDSILLAENLGIQTITIPITEIFEIFKNTLNPLFAEKPQDKTEENLQARIRGNILMALSNKFGWLVLTTGNKSESATGYSTLYGDTAGGFALISDLYKTQVYSLSGFINMNFEREFIPQAIFSKPPSAELAPNQKDQDTLPPYDILDGILNLYIEENKSIKEIADMGYNQEVICAITDMILKNEYKRHQQPLGPDLSGNRFVTSRDYPITLKNFKNQ